MTGFMSRWWWWFKYKGLLKILKYDDANIENYKDTKIQIYRTIKDTMILYRYDDSNI
jgi:hypothetical protein